MFNSSGNGGDCGESMQAILNSEAMGANQPEEPEPMQREDWIFYGCMALLFIIAIIASKWY